MNNMLLQHCCCRPSLLIRWLLLLLLPFAGFAWAIGFSAVNVIHASSDKHSFRQASLTTSPASLSTNNCSKIYTGAPLQNRPATLKIIRFRLRGWSLSSSGKDQAPQMKPLEQVEACMPQSRNKSSVHTAATRPRKFSKRRRLNECTDRDISISQSRDTVAGGPPQFIVQIYNTCMMGACAPSEVHVNCGWFASKVVVNPGIFRRLSFNDCLVNAGRPIARGQIVRFTYQNSFMYPLSFKSAQFC